MTGDLNAWVGDSGRRSRRWMQPWALSGDHKARPRQPGLASPSWATPRGWSDEVEGPSAIRARASMGGSARTVIRRV